MKLYVVEKNNVEKYIYDEKNSSSYSIPFSSYQNKNLFILIDAVEDKKIIYSTGQVDVLVNNEVVDSVEILPNNMYTLRVNGKEIVYIYTFKMTDNNLYKFDVNNLSNISIGTSENSNIKFSSMLMQETHAYIKLTGEYWSIVSNTPIFINSYKKSAHLLNVGDIIFINGMKIVWMKKFILVTAYNNDLLKINDMQTSKEVIFDRTYVDEEDSSCDDIFLGKEFFYHTPRLSEKIEVETVSLDGPPKTPIGEELPLILVMGSSLTMVAYSFIRAYDIYEKIKEGAELSSLTSSLVICFAMLFGSLIMPRALAAYKKKQNKIKEALRQEKYTEYIQNKERAITNILNAHKQILFSNHISALESITVINSRNKYFWFREIADEDFLKVRLGIGNVESYIKFNSPEKHFSLEEDNLLDLVHEIPTKFNTLSTVPITYSLVENKLTSIIANFDKFNFYLEGILLQILATHSPSDLKIVLLSNNENIGKWDFLKICPHIFSDDKSLRFFSTTDDDANEISNYLEKIIQERIANKAEGGEGEDKEKTEGYKKFSPYYLIITDSYTSVKYLPIINSIVKTNNNHGMSLVLIDETTKYMPSECNSFIEVTETSGGVLYKDLNSKLHRVFVPEIYNNLNIKEYSKVLLNVPTSTNDGVKELPTHLTFLDMYNVSKIEHLNILNNWQTNDPELSLSALIGVHASGDSFKLNLHEKAHGPHGLIAGSTGSGKSEFIITYILSMAINYHPYEVQFVLVDYKGGGLAGAFENKELGIRLPHLVGTITNLDIADMHRTLTSINSEVKRRQIVFNEVRESLGESTINIYKYQKLYREGAIKEPMSHLFIVCDEFAELKSQQPEFMNDLISISRIGRSLGIHLILATQKPSGVVNEQIWSNSKFKICLKVQSRGDSMEMLKRPEAASIKEAGRFYLQIGFDEYFDIGQSGWAGAKYVPSDRIVKKYDTALNYINDLGYTYKSIKEVNPITTNDQEKNVDQLTSIVRFISELGSKESLKINDLWLPKIPSEIYLGSLNKKYNYKPVPYHINPVIGEYDVPEAQLQNILNLDLTNDGNTLIVGLVGSGKEHLLSTIIWSSVIEHTPDEVNFYIIDCGSEILRKFYRFPHIGEVLSVTDGEKINGLMEFLFDEIESRRKMFVDYSGSYSEYIANSGSKLPLIVTVINNYEIFNENFTKLSDKIQNLYRDGAKYGIVFIITAINTNTIRGKVLQYFNSLIALKLSNDSDYRSFLDSPRGLTPADNFGRGIIKKNEQYYEFQSAYIYLKNEVNGLIKNYSEQLSNAYIVRARSITIIPSIVDYNVLNNDNTDLSVLPIGYNVHLKNIYSLSLNQINILTMCSKSIDRIKVALVYYLIKYFTKLEKKITIIDMVRIIDSGVENVNLVNDDFEVKLASIYNDILATEEDEEFIIILGVSSLYSFTDNTKQLFPILLEKINSNPNKHLIIMDDLDGIEKLTEIELYKNELNNNTVMWLGSGIKTQNLIKFKDLDKEDADYPEQALCLVRHENENYVLKHAMEDTIYE